MLQERFEERILNTMDRITCFANSRNDMLSDDTERVSLVTEFIRTLKSMIIDCEEILTEIKTPEQVKETPERQSGDVWQDDGWWGMSSEGASGPWNNKQAAEAASRDMFKTAGQHNARNY